MGITAGITELVNTDPGGEGEAGWGRECSVPQPHPAHHRSAAEGRAESAGRGTGGEKAERLIMGDSGPPEEMMSLLLISLKTPSPAFHSRRRS